MLKIRFPHGTLTWQKLFQNIYFGTCGPSRRVRKENTYKELRAQNQNPQIKSRAMIDFSVEMLHLCHGALMR